MTRYGDGPQLEVPVLDEPVVLEAHLEFIKRLGARYDGHPDIDHIDLGTVGWWGEWHMSQSSNAPMPTLETQKKIVDAYLAAFKNTPGGTTSPEIISSVSAKKYKSCGLFPWASVVVMALPSRRPARPIRCKKLA